MQGTRVVIEITPAALSLWVLRAAGGAGAKPVAERRMPLSAASWTEAWPSVLADVQRPLCEWVSELGIAGREAEVAYVSPSGAVALVSCPHAAGESGAHRAAELAVAGPAGMGNAKGGQPLTATATLSIDAPTREAGVVRQCHVLAVSETELSASAVSACVQGAGLRVARLLPLDAVSLMQASSLARESNDRAEPNGCGQAVRVVVWLGHTSTLVLAASAGRVRFFRSLSTGTEPLVDCFGRPLRGRAEGAKAFTPDRSAARRMLEHGGIPTPEMVVDAEHGVDGMAVLPSLQPVLQRLAVELKQTLRFGVPEAEREFVRVVFAGPGGAVPRLAEVVCQLSGLGAEQLEAVGGSEAETGGANGTSLARTMAGCEVNLLPPDVAEERRLSRMRRVMWAGIGSAAALIMMYAGSAALTLRSETQRAQGLVASRAGQEKERQIFERSVAAHAATAELRARISARIGESQPISHALAALAEHTGEGMSLTSVDFSSGDDGRMKCVLVGQTASAGAAEVAATLTDYAHRLAGVPIFRNVKLGGTQRQRSGQNDVQRFEVSLELVGLPASFARVAGTAGREGEARP